MLLIQMTGLSGAGKTSIARLTIPLLEEQGLAAEVIDGDEYRKTLCKDLGFSKADRHENIRRLGKLAYDLTRDGKIAIIAAINPYEEIRNELKEKYAAKTVWINCSKEELIVRDTKGLYKRALLPDGHPDKVKNLTGISDVYEEPPSPDLTILTHTESADDSARQLFQFIIHSLKQ
ncbi:MAG: adenylyl-sulfate kinase [Chitinophagaceae bacterium]|nr:adenylyl-sulfate kinase [Chitinophagaceae bacterium]